MSLFPDLFPAVVLKWCDVICKILWRVKRFWSWCCSSLWCFFLIIRKVEGCPFSRKHVAIMPLSLGWCIRHMKTWPFSARGFDCHPDSRWHPALCKHLISQSLSWENVTFWIARCNLFRFQGNIKHFLFYLAGLLVLACWVWKNWTDCSSLISCSHFPLFAKAVLETLAGLITLCF